MTDNPKIVHVDVNKTVAPEPKDLLTRRINRFLKRDLLLNKRKLLRKRKPALRLP